MGGKTDIALVFNLLLVFKYADRDLSGLPILVPISSLLHFFPNIPTPGLFEEDISKQYFDMYITVPQNDFWTLKYVSCSTT